MANCFYPEEIDWAPPHHASSSFQFHSWSTPIEEVEEDKVGTNSSSHSQVEKRRRDRINAQLASLRKLIPKSDKMDKATLLGSAIDHVKELKRKALEVGKVFTVPTEIDEVTVEFCDCDDQVLCTSTSGDKLIKENVFIKASVCCDNRPELFEEVARALKDLRLRMIRADMASLGGRIKSILVVCTNDVEQGVSVSSLKQSLTVVLSRIVSSSIEPNYRITGKRARFFFPSY